MHVQRKEVYFKIVEAFENDYSWLGKQFAEELLLSVASWNIQQFSKPPFRLRRHLLLFWQPGWIKSTLLTRAYELLSPELCTIMSDVSLAALRGTVEFGRFVSPYTLKRPFSIATEFGQVVTGGESQDLVQKLLNVLEEGMVTVSLGKISSISALEREEVESKYGISFIDSNTFTYKTNWVLMAGTYNKKFLVDNAFESRFTLVVPDKELNSELTKYINKHRPQGIDPELAGEFRRTIMTDSPINTKIELPDEIYDTTGLTVRQSSYLISYALCRSWWGIETTTEELIELAKRIKQKSEIVWKSADDRVFDSIEQEGKTADEIATETGLSKRQVYYSLKNIRASAILDEGTKKWRML
jgi:hypothetical protein